VRLYPRIPVEVEVDLTMIHSTGTVRHKFPDTWSGFCVRYKVRYVHRTKSKLTNLIKTTLEVAVIVLRISEQRARQAHIELWSLIFKNKYFKGHTPAGPAQVSPTRLMVKIAC
jgi:hypothetical protein